MGAMSDKGLGSPHDRPAGGSAADQLYWYRDARQPAPPGRPGRPRSIRREHWVDALACLSVATLCLSPARREALFIDDWDFYNRVPLGAPVLVADRKSVV